MLKRPLVGRTAELKALSDALAVDAPAGVVRISGPVGIGKSALLFRALQTCIERSIPYQRLDPALDRVDPASIRRAFDELGDTRRVLLIEDIHLAREAERWLTSNLHDAGQATTIIVADRQRVSLAWFGGGGITPIEIALGPLTENAETELFDAYDVSSAARGAATSLAEGNPLLLTLFADGERKGARAVEEALLRLASSLFPAYDEAPRIAALAVLAIAPAATHELIASVIGDARGARDVGRWLRSLSVIENTRDGLALHPAARRACSSLMRTHHRVAYQQAVDAVREVRQSVPPSAEPRMLHVDVPPSRAPAPTSVVVSAWRGGSAAIAVTAEAPSPQFSELLRERLDDLARQASLTDREREVFELLVLGRSANEMSTVLGITTRTVKFHQQRVLEKIGADSRLDILRLLL